MENGADPGLRDHANRLPIEIAIFHFELPSSQGGNRLLTILQFLGTKTKFQRGTSPASRHSIGRSLGLSIHDHPVRVRYLVRAVGLLSGTDWQVSFAQFILQIAASCGWADVCRKFLRDRLADADLGSPWIVATPRQIAMASFSQLRVLFQKNGTFVGRYKLGGRLHFSPNCVVLDAIDVTKDQPVVVKLLRDADDFMRECQSGEIRDGIHVLLIVDSSTQHDAKLDSAASSTFSWSEAAKGCGFDKFQFGIVMPKAHRSLLIVRLTEVIRPDGSPGLFDEEPQGIRQIFSKLAKCLEV